MTTLANISVDLIDSSIKNPRKIFDEESIDSLAASIDRLGVLQPILVRKIIGTERFEIIAGERRWRASQRAKKDTIPAIILEPDEQIAAEIRLMENLERDQLNIIEEAKAFEAMLELFNCNENTLAQRLKRSPQYVCNRIELLKLEPIVQNMVVNKQISIASAIEIARNVHDAEDQVRIANQISDHSLTSNATVQLIREYNLSLRLRKQNELKKLKMQQKVEHLSSQGVITWQNFDPLKHQRIWSLVFNECATCDRKGRFLRADNIIEDICIDSVCFNGLSKKYGEIRDLEVKRVLKERKAAFDLVLESETVSIEHLQYLLWLIVQLLGYSDNGGLAMTYMGRSKSDTWHLIASLSEEQLLTQIVRITVLYLSDQSNNELPEDLRYSLMKRFGIPSSVLFEKPA